MAKLACHGHNYKKGAVGGIDNHNRRLSKNHSNEDIDPTRTHLNITFKETKNLYQDCKTEVERVKQNGGRLRSDQNWITEFVTYAPPNLPDKDCQEYFQTVYDYFKEVFGENNIKSAVVHMDEHTAHMHLDAMPLIRDKSGRPVKLSSKEIITRKFLTDIHDNLPKKLKEKGFDVERGNKVKVEDRHLKGRSVRKFKADMEREKAQIEKEIEKLEDCHTKNIITYGIEEDEWRSSIKELEEKNSALSAEIDSKTAQIENMDDSLRNLQKQQEEANAKFQRVKKSLETAQNELDKVLNDTDTLNKTNALGVELQNLLDEVRPLAEVLKDEYSIQTLSVVGDRNTFLQEKLKKINETHRRHSTDRLRTKGAEGKTRKNDDIEI